MDGRNGKVPRFFVNVFLPKGVISLFELGGPEIDLRSTNEFSENQEHEIAILFERELLESFDLLEAFCCRFLGKSNGGRFVKTKQRKFY